MADRDESEAFDALLRKLAETPRVEPGLAVGPGARLLDGRLTVGRQLGSGGMGVVYEVHDREHNEKVALKTLQRMDPAALYMFKNEFRALSNVVHPNLVRQYELFSDEGHWFFTMELIRGCSFSEWIRRGTQRDKATFEEAMTEPDTTPVRGGRAGTEGSGTEGSGTEGSGTEAQSRFDEVRLRDAFKQFAAGVRALHATGKLHRDLKPSNVLVTETGRLVILDLGLTQDSASEGIGHTVPEHSVPGTPGFIAPELLIGEPATEAIDWYAFGVMLFEALTGRPPFQGSAISVMHQKTQKPAPSPAASVSGLPDDLVQLCEQLLQIDPRRRPGGEAIQGRLGAPDARLSVLPEPRGAARTLVGRTRELAVLKQALAETDEGMPAVVVIEGASGVGKTALVESFLGRIEASDRPVTLFGACHEAESVPYKAFDALADALSRLLRTLPDDEAKALMPRQIQALARVFPVLQRVEVVSSVRRRAPLPVDPRVLQRTAFGALKELLGRLAASRPVVMVLDDLQWGDVESARLLLELLSPQDPPALLVIATHRQAGPDRGDCLRFLQQQNWQRLGVAVHTLALDPLSREDAATLAAALGPGRMANAESIAYESGGNPYFVQELVRFSQENQLTGVSGSTDSVSVRFNLVLAGRVASLPEAARQALEATCVASGPVPQSAITKAASLADGQGTIRLLRAANLVRVVGARGSGPIASFHYRIRHTVLRLLSPEEQKRWHQRLAHALVQEKDPDPTVLCTHLMNAGATEQAMEYAIAAGDRASHQLAFDQAAHFYRLAVDHGHGSDAGRATLQIKLSRALVNAERGPEAAICYQLAAAESEPGEALELRRIAAEELLLAGHMKEGAELLDQALEAVGEQMSTRLADVLDLAGSRQGPSEHPEDVPSTRATSPSISGQQALTTMLSLRSELLERGFEFEARTDQTRLPAEDRRRTDTCWSAAFGLTMIQSGLNRPFTVRHLVLALELGEPGRIARGLCLYAMQVESVMRQPLNHLLDQATQIAADYPDARTEGWVAMARGYTALFALRPGSAIGYLESAHQTFRNRCTGVAREVGTCEAALTWARAMCGLHRDVMNTYLPWLRDAERRGNWYLVTSLKVYAIPSLILGDEVDLVRRYAQEASAPEALVDNQAFRLTALSVAGMCDSYRGDPEGFAKVSAWADEFLESVYATVDLYRLGFYRTRGLAALVAAQKTGSHQPYLTSANDDADALEAIDAVQPRAHAAAIRAGIAALGGDAGGALQWLEQARSINDGPEGDLLLGSCIRHQHAALSGEQEKLTAAELAINQIGAVDASRTANWLIPGIEVAATT